MKYPNTFTLPPPINTVTPPGTPTIWYKPTLFSNVAYSVSGGGGMPNIYPAGGPPNRQVGRLLDLSGNGFHATQSTSTLQPLYYAKSLNFFWSLASGGPYQAYLEATGLSIPRTNHSGGMLVDLQGMNTSPLIDLGVAAGNLEFGIGTNKQTIVAYDGSSYIDTGFNPTSRGLVITWRSTGSGLIIHVNGQVYSGSAISGSGTMTKLRLGSWLNGNCKPMRLYETVIYNSDIGSSAQTALDTYLRGNARSFDPTWLWVVVGDDLSIGKGPIINTPWHDIYFVDDYYGNTNFGFQAAFNATWMVFAADGATLATPPVPAATVAALKTGGLVNATAIVWLGTNDIISGGMTGAQAYTAYSSYCNTLKSAGFNVLACTLQAFTTNNTERVNFNNALVANYSFAQQLARIDQTLTDSTNTANYCADGIHLTNGGQYQTMQSMVNVEYFAINQWAW